MARQPSCESDQRVATGSTEMNGKRFDLALVVAFVAATLFDIVLNGVALRSAFEAGAQYCASARGAVSRSR